MAALDIDASSIGGGFDGRYDNPMYDSFSTRSGEMETPMVGSGHYPGHYPGPVSTGMCN